MILIMAIYIFFIMSMCFDLFLLSVLYVNCSSCANELTGTPPIIMGRSVRSWVQDPLGVN